MSRSRRRGARVFKVERSSSWRAWRRSIKGLCSTACRTQSGPVVVVVVVSRGVSVEERGINEAAWPYGPIFKRGTVVAWLSTSRDDPRFVASSIRKLRRRIPYGTVR